MKAQVVISGLPWSAPNNSASIQAWIQTFRGEVAIVSGEFITHSLWKIDISQFWWRISSFDWLNHVTSLMLLKCQCLLVRSTIFGGLWSWLVVSTPLKNMKVSWDDYPIYDGKWHPCLEPPTRIPNLLLAKSSPVTGHCRSLSPRRPSDPRRCRTQQISHLRMELSGLQSGWCFLYSTPKAENWFKLSTILRQDSMFLFFLGGC